MKGLFRTTVNLFKSTKEKNGNRFTDEDNFLYHSGERQTSSTLGDIRADHRARYKLAITFIKKHFLKKEDLFGLDIFTGNGYGAYMLAAETSSFILGIDGSEEAISFANIHYPHEKVIFSNKIFPFKLPKGIFDFITCFESIEHVKNDEMMLVQLHRALKNNGLIFISFPNQARLPLDRNFHKFHYRHYYHKDFLSKFDKFSDMKLIDWFGQNIYLLNGEKPQERNECDIEIFDNEEEGQFNFYVFKKL